MIFRTLACVLMLWAGPAMAEGTWVDTSFVPPSLGFDNPIAVYLPEGYDPMGSTDYQVTIWLHGWGNHCWSNNLMIGQVHDSLVTEGDIEPCIIACPEGWCPPYSGSMWANSLLYGDYEHYVTDDVITFLDTNYCTLGDASRYIMGSSMGGSGSLDIALRHPSLFQCVCTSSAVPDMVIDMPYVIERVLIESPESQPPYTYDWGNGFYTDAEFMYAGGYSPNLSAPDSVDFPLDENGLLIDSVYSLYELHNPAHMVKLNPPSELMIGLAWGLNDLQVGLVESNYAFADTLTDLGLPHVVYTDLGGHSLIRSRLARMMLIAMGDTGIEGGSVLPSIPSLSPVLPNPFSSTANIRFHLPESDLVSLDIYDLSGRLIVSMVNSVLPGGDHVFGLDGSVFGAGVYLIRLETSAGVYTERCVRL